jgi:RNA polymerase sigma-70 factor (ECF subfamily)
MRVARPRAGQQVLTDSAAASPNDPELEALKRTYGSAFREALRRELQEMSRDDRLLLKRRFGRGLSCEELAALYGVHRSTAARRIADACGRLAEGVRTSLVRQLNLGRAEIDSLLPLLESELSLSLSSVGAAGNEPVARGSS